ncbi:hypothetical protein KM043_003094 [Ampulex compressa]|nr:hypothetical protein KM043_003094 [Ampulex compressa]
MANGIANLLLLLLSLGSIRLQAQPLDMAEDNGESDRGSFDLDEGNGFGARREEAMEKLQEILGIRGHTENSSRRKVAPQFMMELYNSIADSSGVTRGRNPYNAKVVRSFIERDTSMAHFYFFNISGLEVNESVLEAELHLYRKRTPLRAMHPSTLTSPYYIIFNVKQAVLAWLNGEANLGLLVTASTLFEDQVSVEFSRRNEYHHSKQPILVLFDDDGGEYRAGSRAVPRYYTYGNDNDLEEGLPYDAEDETVDVNNEFEGGHGEGQRRPKYELEEARAEDGNASEYFHRQKRKREDGRVEDSVRSSKRPRREAAMPGRARNSYVPTSMEIYEMAARREKRGDSRSTEKESGQRRQRSVQEGVQPNATECSRHELYVDFKDIGLSSSIIAPVGYSAYQCKGICESPLSQNQQPTNHATIQGIVHKMGLVKGVDRPCCVPTKLLGTTILYFDDNENVVLKVYQDMIADRCGCR